MNLSTQIKHQALQLGFDACGIAPVACADSEAAHFDRWIDQGCHAGMKYMENYRDIRLNPAGLVEGARSIISVALNYYPAMKQQPGAPRIAYYAYGKDYHVVMKDKLHQLWGYIANLVPVPPAARLFTDSAPILERYWAWRAGLGWIGRNTNLIIPRKGSYFFLGEIVTTLEVDAYDTPLPNRCGNCRRCLEACPTGALEHSQRLNANKCISYLTIEHKGDIPPSLPPASAIGCTVATPASRYAPGTVLPSPPMSRLLPPRPPSFLCEKKTCKILLETIIIVYLQHRPLSEPNTKACCAPSTTRKTYKQ